MAWKSESQKSASPLFSNRRSRNPANDKDAIKLGLFPAIMIGLLMIPTMIVAPIFIHELGHVIMASLLNVNLTWTSWNHATFWEYSTPDGLAKVHAILIAGDLSCITVGSLLVLIAYIANKKRFFHPYAFAWIGCLAAMTLLYGIGQIVSGYWI